MDGWFKLHRKITESAIFSDPDLLRLWIYCLSKAAFKPTTLLIDKREIHLQPGQFVTGRFSLHSEFNSGVRNSKRVKETTLWSWLKRLESYGNLDIKSYNKYSVVTVVKWYEYQDNLTTEQQQTDNRLTTDCQQTDTNKNLKKYKNDKNIYSSSEETEISVMDAYTKSFGQLVMPETIRDYVKKLKESGQTDEMIIELLLEVGESSTKPNLRFLEAIGNRWVEHGIQSREQAKAIRNTQKQQPKKTVPFNGKPNIPIVQSSNDERVSDEEFEEMLALAQKMQGSEDKSHAKKETA